MLKGEDHMISVKELPYHISLLPIEPQHTISFGWLVDFTLLKGMCQRRIKPRRHVKDYILGI